MIGVTITPSHIDYSKLIDDNVAEKLVLGSCIVIEGQAKELVHRVTGALCNSISSRTTTEDHGFNQSPFGGDDAPPESEVSKPNEKATGYVGSNLEYAGAVEYGIKDKPNYPRNPYMRPAVDYTKKDREKWYNGVMSIAIKQAYHG
jgi:hypothetical protein